MRKVRRGWAKSRCEGESDPTGSPQTQKCAPWMEGLHGGVRDPKGCTNEALALYCWAAVNRVKPEANLILPLFVEVGKFSFSIEKHNVDWRRSAQRREHSNTHAICRGLTRNQKAAQARAFQLAVRRGHEQNPNLQCMRGWSCHLLSDLLSVCISCANVRSTKLLS